MGSVFDVLAQSFQELDILHRPLAMSDPIQHIDHHVHSHSAWDALAAGFLNAEVGEESGRVHHAGGFIANDDSARAHDGPCGL
jgi:hypothetical protein